MYLEADLNPERLLDSVAALLEEDLSEEVDSPDRRAKLFSVAGLLRNVRPSELASTLSRCVEDHRAFLEELLGDCPDAWAASAREQFPLDLSLVRERLPTSEYGVLRDTLHGLRQNLSRLIVELDRRSGENSDRAKALRQRCHDFALDRAREDAGRIRSIRWSEIL